MSLNCIVQISSNQIPRPYKAPDSVLRAECGGSPDYSNIRVRDVTRSQPAPTFRPNKLEQSDMASLSSINYSVLRKNTEDNSRPALPSKLSYTSLQYSTIDHSKTIKARRENSSNKSSVNGPSVLGPQITSPKPSLHLSQRDGRKPSQVQPRASTSPVNGRLDGKEASFFFLSNFPFPCMIFVFNIFFLFFHFPL